MATLQQLKELRPYDTIVDEQSGEDFVLENIEQKSDMFICKVKNDCNKTVHITIDAKSNCYRIVPYANSR